MLKSIFSPKRTNSAPDGVRLCAIGDIHGRRDLLDALLVRIEAEEADGRTRLVFLGDYIDRGGDSKSVIDRLIELRAARPDTVFLKGNHEAAALDFLVDPGGAEEWLHWGGAETLQSYGLEDVWRTGVGELAVAFARRLPAAHREFLEGLPTTFECGDFIFVHAGLRPGVALKDQTESDLLWIRGAFHDAAPDERPAKTVVHGHHPIRRPLDAGWRIAIDTGAVWSDMLTAALIEGSECRFLSTA